MSIRKAIYTENEVHAVRACVVGVATGDQQKTAMDWIMREAAKIGDLSYQPGEDGRRDTDFAEGRRYVGALIRQMGEPLTLQLAKKADADKAAAERRAS